MKGYKIEMGKIEAPVYTKHKRGRNWCAIIHEDPTAPRGIGRVFLKGSRGGRFYGKENFRVGQVLEFGADYISASGNRYPERIYAVVINISEEEITVEEFKTPKKAIRFAESILKEK